MKKITRILMVTLVTTMFAKINYAQTTPLTIPELEKIRNEVYKNPTQELLNKYNAELDKTMLYLKENAEIDEVLPVEWAKRIKSDYAATGEWTNPYSGKVLKTDPAAYPLVTLGVEMALIRSSLIFARIFESAEELRNKIKNENEKSKERASFSYFSMNYVAKELSKWEEKGQYEKTEDWKVRVNKKTREQKIDELTYEAIDVYGGQIMKEISCSVGLGDYICAKYRNGKYDADKEIYSLTITGLGTFPFKMPADTAQAFDACIKNDYNCSFFIRDVIYFIQNDQLRLAAGQFGKKGQFGDKDKYKYKYINPSPEAQAQIERKAKEYANKGWYTYAKSENYSKAIEYYELASRYPSKLDTNPDFYRTLGSVYYTYGEKKEYESVRYYKLAVEAYEKAASLAPSDTLYIWIGDLYEKVYSYSNAAQAYEKAINLAPDNDKVYVSLGNIYYGKMKDYSKALENYEKAVNINPNNSAALYNIGLVYVKLKDKKNAKEFFTRAAKLGHDDAQRIIKDWKKIAKNNF
jgi:tetratricopeptide (TPR) repeat protein